MFQSKSVKSGRWSDNHTRWEAFYWKVYDKLEYTWSVKTYENIKHFFRCLRRWYSWRKTVWANYDWDFHYFYVMTAEKLRRIEHALVNGHCEQDTQHMRALGIAVKLSKRIAEFEYEDRHYRKHNSKWGELETWFEPIPSTARSLWCSKRAGASTPELKEQERAEWLAGYELAEKVKDRDIKYLFAIIRKYGACWWD